MAAKLGVFIIHGMGDHESSFAEKLIRQLYDRLGSLQAEVAFESCYWAPILQKHQNLIWSRLQRNKGMNAKWLRKWVVSALGDPVCYMSGYFKPEQPVYTEIHECMRRSLQTLRGRLGSDDSKPLMIIAHSLGSVIVSNYIWDETHGRSLGQNSFEKTTTLTSLITYGSNIPLFLPPVSPIECISFPSPGLPAALAGVASWKNIFDPDDILGYPLNDIWDDKHGTTIQDIDINAGFWPISEMPAAHTKYDSDDDFIDIAYGEIVKIINL